jgi:hypothetical protein
MRKSRKGKRARPVTEGKTMNLAQTWKHIAEIGKLETLIFDPAWRKATNYGTFRFPEHDDIYSKLHPIFDRQLAERFQFEHGGGSLLDAVRSEVRKREAIKTARDKRWIEKRTPKQQITDSAILKSWKAHPSTYGIKALLRHIKNNPAYWGVDEHGQQRKPPFSGSYLLKAASKSLAYLIAKGSIPAKKHRS